MTKSSKGFTIIELLVVVAIIAVLAAIVLFNVTKYIQSGKIAAGKGNMAGLQIDGAVYFDTNSNYAAFCGTYFIPGKARYDAVTGAGWTLASPSCFASATAWCALATEPGITTTFCVDSAGNKLEKAAGSCSVTGATSGTCI